MKYKDHPKWIFLRHEDVSMNPVEEFKKVFMLLQVPFSKKIKKRVLETTQEEKNDFRSKNAKKNITLWKERLTEGEILRIKLETQTVWNRYYTEGEW